MAFNIAIYTTGKIVKFIIDIQNNINYNKNCNISNYIVLPM